MSVGLKQPESINPVNGAEVAGVACGIKTNGDSDLALLVFDENTTCAATFTQNAFCAAPVTIAKKHLESYKPRALIINSGNANSGTGQKGLEDAYRTCEYVAEQIACKAEEVLPFSTGVIGEYLPMHKLSKGIADAKTCLSSDNWMSVATAIMTTDTVAKAISARFSFRGQTVNITGVAKGSGMICPNMATLLAFIVTDASVADEYLQQCLNAAVKKSFNSITVDGDTSTNDACVLVATGALSDAKIGGGDEVSELFASEVEKICVYLAQSVIRDGEGATKFVTVNVEQAADENEARTVAYTVAHSPLVKTALYASDPNWGRILAAVGRADIESLILEDISIFLNDLCIISDGERDAEYTEEKGQAVMNLEEIEIRILLKRGDFSTSVWTSDLSNEYVRINAEYRS